MSLLKMRSLPKNALEVSRTWPQVNNISCYQEFKNVEHWKLAHLVGDLELGHDLVSVNSRKDVDNCLTTDVVAFNIQQLQCLVLMQ